MARFPTHTDTYPAERYGSHGKPLENVTVTATRGYRPEGGRANREGIALTLHVEGERRSIHLALSPDAAARFIADMARLVPETGL